MKTPREILFERHRKAAPQLDQLRTDVLAALSTATPHEQDEPVLRAIFRKFWSEVIWPSRRAWAGMAALWLVICAINFQMRSGSTAVAKVPVGEFAKVVKEQRQVLAELVQTRPPVENVALPVTPSTPRPRSERRLIFKAC